MNRTAPAETLSEPVRVHFIKHLVDPNSFRFAGTTTGHSNGVLHSQILSETAPESERFRFLSFRWTIAGSESDDDSFVAETHGTLDKTTGEVVMAGTIVSGWNTGASVIERGQLIDAATFTFEGDLVLLCQ